MIKYNNNHGHVDKDHVISELIPDEISECALHLDKTPGQPCSSPEIIGAIGDLLGATGPAEQIIVAAKDKLGCDTEKCVLDKMQNELGEQRVRAEIETRFKLRGPNGTELLSNFNIDGILQQWCSRFTDFYAYNFNMVNYADYSIVDGYVVARPDTLATVNFSDLYAKGFRCGACVINSDKYQGRGKHWMALFFDARSDDWSVEFFNSGGNAPAAEWVNWTLKTAEQMRDVAKVTRAKTGRAITISVIRSSSIRHQHSKTECGLYSLFYIYARLCGVPYTYFKTTPVPDQLMFELRQHLFLNDASGHVGVELCGGKPKFNFDKFKKQVNIEWERD